jgi:hypothetical protein
MTSEHFTIAEEHGSQTAAPIRQKRISAIDRHQLW